MTPSEGARQVKADRLTAFGASAACRHRLTVIYTTPEATAAALETAAQLGRGLGGRLWLLVPEVVPHRLPIDCPPVALEHIRNGALALASGFHSDGCEVEVEVCLCRSRRACIAGAVSPQSVILLGGRRSWWSTPERRLERALRAAGYQVIFVEQ